jgi:hypothetical protein
MCFKQRRVPAIIVSILSILVAILGLIMLIESIVYQTKPSILTAELGDLDGPVFAFRIGTFVAMIIAALLAICVGCFGSCCTFKPCIKHRGYSICFGLTITLIWIIFIVVGGVMTSISEMGPKQIDLIC